MRCSTIMASRPGASWRASISAGTRAACMALPSSATARTRKPIRVWSRRCWPTSTRRGAAAPRHDVMTAAAGPDLAELFAAIPVALLGVDPAQRIVHANAECESLLNLSERVMIGQPLDTVLRVPGEPDRRAEHGFTAFDSEIVLARGGSIRADYLESQLPEHPGWRMIALHHDAASRRLGHSADRASAARAAVGAAAMLAHEIKNPLSGIRGAAQLLAGGGEGGDELTTLITTEVDRIAALIDSMQGFTDTRPPALASANIYPLLDHARRVALAGFARDVRFDEHFDPSLPPAMVDRDALLQVIINLIKHACEAIAGQGDARIVLSSAFRHGMAVSPAPGRPRQALPIELCV